MIEREVLWERVDGPGLEHLRLVLSDGDARADGLVLGVAGAPFRLRYELRCDGAWCVRSVTADLLSGEGGRLELIADGAGFWRTTRGSALPEFGGCVDVDISATPFTNTLPIRRLRLAPGDSSDLRIAYVEVPSLELSVSEQRYTCLDRSEAGGRYRFESGTFAAELTVDPAGLVLDYEGLFRRLR
jgi:uncharacterized protein